MDDAVPHDVRPMLTVNDIARAHSPHCRLWPAPNKIPCFSFIASFHLLRSEDTQRVCALKGISDCTVNDWQVISMDEPSSSNCLTAVRINVPLAGLSKVFASSGSAVLGTMSKSCVILCIRISFSEKWGEVSVMQLPELAWLTAEWSYQFGRPSDVIT